MNYCPNGITSQHPRTDSNCPHDAKRPEFSEVLQRGLCETIALIGSRGDDIQDAMRGQDRAISIVRQILIEEPDWHVWCTLSDRLPDLAEAAPDEFLDGVEDVVIGNEATFNALFQEEEKVIAASSAHTGLLWALERLAWSPDYLSRVAIILGRLAARDPGGSLSNRPERSLREFFINWHPNTNATLERRMEALDALANVVPDVAWRRRASAH